MTNLRSFHYYEYSYYTLLNCYKEATIFSIVELNL